MKKISIAIAILSLWAPAAVFSQNEAALENAFTKVADKVGSAVVTIYVEKPGKVAQFCQGGVFAGDEPTQEFLKHFCQNLPQAEYRQQGLGSGVIIDKVGHVLTNQHVIDGATKITVILPDGRTFEGEVQGEDRRSDIAVLKIDAKDLPYAELGDSDSLKAGQWAIAIGNPFGNVVKSPQPTVTVGVISALHRSLPVTGQSVERSYLDLIQTDAAINIGNSGGPLCDLNGNVIGINVAMFSQAGGNIGIGFAIPVNRAKRILSDLIRGKKVVYGWLGVGIQDITQDIADYFKLPNLEGILVAQVQPGSPAEKSGLKAGDIVRTYNGEPVKDMKDFVGKINYSKVGDKARLGIIREGKEMDLAATVGVETAQRPAAANQVPATPAGMWRGMRVSNITPDLASRLNLIDRSGVVIVEMVPNSPSYNAGLRPGDVIREVGRAGVSDESDYNKAIARVKGSVLLKTDKGYVVIGQ